MSVIFTYSCILDNKPWGNLQASYPSKIDFNTLATVLGCIIAVIWRNLQVFYPSKRVFNTVALVHSCMVAVIIFQNFLFLKAIPLHLSLME